MLKPHAMIRRFDVFAEYARQQAIEEGMREAIRPGESYRTSRDTIRRAWKP